MTRKDYEAIAKAVRATVEELSAYPDPMTVLIKVVTRVAKVLHEDNSRFDVARFMKACGL